MEKNIVLSIDPSGTGTTGIVIVVETKEKKKEIIFSQFKDIFWEKHLFFIYELANKWKPNIVIYENTNYIHRRIQSSLSLFKLLGSIVALKHSCSFIAKISTVAVNQVKKERHKLQNKEIIIDNLSYKKGRGEVESIMKWK